MQKLILNHHACAAIVLSRVDGKQLLRAFKSSPEGATPVCVSEYNSLYEDLVEGTLLKCEWTLITRAEVCRAVSGSCVQEAREGCDPGFVDRGFGAWQADQGQICGAALGDDLL